MGLSGKNVKGPGTTYQPVESGIYPAFLIEVVDMGIQPQREYQGETKPPMQHICLTYQFADEFLPDDEGEPDEEKPRVISEILPLHPIVAQRATSTQRYMSLDPNNQYDWEWEGLVGTPCMLEIKTRTSNNTGKPYSNIKGVAPVRAKAKETMGEPILDLRYFEIDNPDLEVFMALNNWKQAKIMDGIGFERTKLAKALPEDYTPGDTRSNEEREMDDPEDKAQKAAAARRAQRQEDEDEVDDEIPY